MAAKELIKEAEDSLWDVKVHTQAALNKKKEVMGLLDKARTALDTEEEDKKKLVKETATNLLCYILDKHENEPLGEGTLQEIGVRFLKSKYNKALNSKGGE